MTPRQRDELKDMAIQALSAYKGPDAEKKACYQQRLSRAFGMASEHYACAQELAQILIHSAAFGDLGEEAVEEERDKIRQFAFELSRFRKLKAAINGLEKMAVDAESAWHRAYKAYEDACRELGRKALPREQMESEFVCVCGCNEQFSKELA